MYIMYCSSDEYCEYTGISILSLFENNKEIKNIEILLVDNGISDINKNKLLFLGKKYSRKITFIKCEKQLEEIKGTVPSFNGSYTPYFKILLDKIYPDKVEKIVYIDSDTIINGKLDYFENINMDCKLICAVENPDSYIININEEENEIIKDHNFYFNSGVMLINLKLWREINFSSKIIESISKLKYMRFVDQTILNASVNEELFLRLPYKYNYWGHQWPKKYKDKIYPFYAKYFDQNDIDEAETNPVIIHYKGYLTRPWFKNSTSFAKKQYLYYKKLSPWADIPLKNIFKDSYYKNSSIFKKIHIRLFIIKRNVFERFFMED